MKCDEALNIIDMYVDECVDAYDEKEFLKHIETCESCRKLYREMQEPMNGENVSDINEGQKADSKNLSEI